MKVGRTREKLAKLIELVMPDAGFCDPKTLQINRGSNEYNDRCSWTGKIGNKSICSWSSMTQLVKNGRVIVIDHFTGEIA